MEEANILDRSAQEAPHVLSSTAVTFLMVIAAIGDKLPPLRWRMTRTQHP